MQKPNINKKKLIKSINVSYIWYSRRYAQKNAVLLIIIKILPVIRTDFLMQNSFIVSSYKGYL